MTGANGIPVQCLEQHPRFQYPDHRIARCFPTGEQDGLDEMFKMAQGFQVA